VNKKITELFSELDELMKNLSDFDNQLRFLEVFNHITKMQDTESIPRLLDYIDDDLLKEDYISEELPRCLIFGFSPKDFIPAFLKKVPSLLEKSPDICIDLFQSIFDDEVDINKNSLEVFRKNISLAEVGAVKQLLYILGRNKYCRHPAIIQDLKRQLEIM
jgi:hypothetical protein